MDGLISSGTGGRPRRPSERIDEMCDRFEAAWREGLAPRIEDYLAEAEEADRPALFQELMALERELRRRQGEHPEVKEYLDRFRGYAGIVCAAFGAQPDSGGEPAAQPRRDTDRNLLFGILALQNNFIGRDEPAERLQLLGRRQVARARPDPPATRRPLAGAVATFGGAGRRAHPAARRRSRKEPGCRQLDRLVSRRPVSSRRPRPSAQPRVTSPLQPPNLDDSDRGTPPPSSVQSTSAGTRFRILRPHAKGGLGEVFVARDTELNRDVALKEIQDRTSPTIRDVRSPGSSSRPRSPAAWSIRGSCRSTGWGTRPTAGRSTPCGSSRGTASRRRSGGFTRPSSSRGATRAGARSSCASCWAGSSTSAMPWRTPTAAACCIATSSRATSCWASTARRWWWTGAWPRRSTTPSPTSPIERSELPLKPSAGSALESTLAGSAVGTPAYMSPEQVDGRVGKLGMLSDVYCLGATLYHLLTGHAPCRGRVRGEIYQKVLTGDIAQPRSLNPRIAAPLRSDLPQSAGAGCQRTGTHRSRRCKLT